MLEEEIIYDAELISEAHDGLEQAARRRKWEEGRARDRKFCMSFCSTGKENPATGKTYYKHIPCGDPLCTTCGPAIREEMQKALEIHKADGTLRRLVVDTEVERAKIIRKYKGKDNVSCFPFEDSNGQVHFELLVKTDDEIGEKLENITSSDLLRWSDKVFGHSKSGNLHKLEIEKSTPTEERPERVDENIGEFERQDIVVDLSNCKDEHGNTHPDEYWHKRIECETIEQTKHLKPTTIEELERAIPIWRFERQRVIEKYGGVVLHVYHVRILIRESQIDWLRRLETIGIT